MNAGKTHFSVYLAIIILPFLMFYWMLPFVSDMTMGSDYLRYAFSQQIELLFSLKTGSFPLYVPGFSSGHPSSALTLGQIFHPLSHLASIMPGYWNGKAIEWNNLFKLLSLGITHLVLFLFLREMRLNSLFSFLLSFITVYNLRSVHLFSQAASLEAYTGYLILCAMIGLYFIRPTKHRWPLCIIGATYLLICSGHPEEMYYGLIGAGLFAFISPFYLSVILFDRKVDFKIALSFWLKIGCYFFVGILLSSAYILPFYFDFISANIFRVGQSYAMAVSNLDTFFGTLNNFFLPLHSDTKGAFGGSSLILIVAILPILRVFKIRIPCSIWTIWGVLLIMFLYIQGSRTPIHELAWKYLPFASSIRVAGRISLIMPFFIMLILAWVVKAKPVLLRVGSSSVKMSPSAVLAYFALLFLIIYSLWYVAAYNIFSFIELQEYFRYPIGKFMNIRFFWITLIMVILGIISLISFAIYSERDGTKVIGIVLIIVTLVQLAFTLKYRSAHWAEVKYNSPTLEEILKKKKNTLEYPYQQDPTFQTSVVINHLSRSFLEPYLGKIYTQVISVSNQDDAYKRMSQARLPQQIFIEGYKPEKAIAITGGAKDMKDGGAKLVYSSFNRLRFHVNSQALAFFGLSYPYTGHWRATVNEKNVQVYRANGIAHAVEIPAGESFVEFRYWSNTVFWGMFISFTIFVVIGFFVSITGFKGIPRIIVAMIVLITGTGLFMLWYNSLYNGDNLETEYAWTYIPPQKIPNLAYGKKTWISPPPARCDYCGPDFSHTLLIDGDYSKEASFSTQDGVGPSWFLDLYSKEEIKTILLYEDSNDLLVNVRPLEISFSDDGDKWRHAVSIESLAQSDVPTRIDFERPQSARYIRINATGESALSFNEVEVYGPE